MLLDMFLLWILQIICTVRIKMSIGSLECTRKYAKNICDHITHKGESDSSVASARVQAQHQRFL